MESMISTNHMSKALNYNSSDGTYYCSDDEESSWSFYLEEFESSYPCNNETETESDSLFSGSKTSSVASFTLTDPNCQQRFCGRLISAKRRKTDFSLVDHDLEDTASSPDHTPKMNKFSIFQKPNFLQNLHKQQQDGGYGDAFSQELGRVNFAVEKRGNDDTAELRRKGLCLVPVSMFLDYYVS